MSLLTAEVTPQHICKNKTRPNLLNACWCTLLQGPFLSYRGTGVIGDKRYLVVILFVATMRL